jgi:hypothetical protein
MGTAWSGELGRLRAIRPVLQRYCGRSWPFVLGQALWRRRGLIRHTRWAERHDAEARFAQGLTLLPALAIVLGARLGARTPEALRELVLAALEGRRARAGSPRLPTGPADARACWHAHFDRGVLQGVGAFNETECLSLDIERFHVRVLRCLFSELALDLGLPELAQSACAASGVFNAQVLPGHDFHRGGSERHTLAYGHPFCDYVWELRETSGVDTTSAVDPSGSADGPEGVESAA